MAATQGVPRWIAAIPLAACLALLCIAVFDPRESAFPAGRGSVAMAGLAFGWAGAAVLINTLATPHRQLLLALNSSALLLSLGAVPLVMAWHGGGVRWPLLVGGLVCVSLAAGAVRSARRERPSEKGRPTSRCS